MDWESDALRAYMLDKAGTTEETPFGPDALVFKVCGKMFGLLAWKTEPLRISLKCDPQQALVLRDCFEAVKPGYHLNKKHWNTITLDNSIPAEEIFGMMDDSYQLVVKGLRKADREALQQQ
ncbi:MAG: MmcQ/YjbR family DNA-binding protein [Pseudomonadota bacterium]